MAEHTLSPMKRTIVGVQFMFVAFGSTVLVPILCHLDPAIALLAAGLGTLLFHAVTGGKVPIYLGSSFAFIAPIIKATELYGLPGMFCGLMAVGVVYMLMSLLVKAFGVSFIKKLFPPIVIGPVIILIGLSLAGSGVNMAKSNWILALISLAVAVIASIWGKGIVKLIPVVFGAVAGYIVSLIFYRSSMDFTPVAEASWFALPKIAHMTFSWQAILFMAPVAIAPIIEHIGDMYAISSIAGKDFVKDPGLHRTLLGDGLSCCLAAFLGGAPVTTYSEVTGAVSLTKVTDPSVLRIAGVSAVVLALIGKVGAVIQTIPQAVLGGIMLLLFGSIASVGVSNMIESRINMGSTRNLIIDIDHRHRRRCHRFRIILIGRNRSCVHRGRDPEPRASSRQERTGISRKIMKVKIVNKSKNPSPAYATPLSAGMDIRADINEPITLEPLHRQLIPTGLYIALPEGFECQARPRSGLAVKHGITVLNTPGTIDADYRGELKILLVNLSDEPFVIEPGERIAQLVVAKHEHVDWEEVEVLDETERGEGGFGSTGVK